MATQFIGTVAIGTALDIRGFATGVGKLRSAASAVNGPMNKGGGSARTLSRGLDEASRGMNLLAKASHSAVGVIAGVGSALTAVGRTASVVSLTTGLIGVSIAKTGFNWRKTWNQARAVTAGTASEMESLKTLVFELGASTKFTVSEVAGAVDFLGKAGNSAVEQLKLLPTMLDLAAAAGTALPRTADIMTNIAQGLQIAPSQISRYGDMLTAAFLNSNVTLEMLGDTLKKFGPITATLGADFADVATSIGLLGNAGIQGSEAGVHLRRMMINLSDSMSKMRTEVVSRLGIAWDDLDVKTRGFIPVLRTLSRVFLNESGKIKSAEMFALASRIFGARAVSTALALMGQLQTGYDDLSTSIRNSAGAMRDTAALQLEGLEPFYRLQAAVELLKISISESGVLDTFANLAEKIAAYFQNMAGASEETRRLAFGILSLVTVAGPAIFVLGLLITSVARVGQMFLFFGTVISFLTTPLGVLTVAILSVVGAAAYLGLRGVEGIRTFTDGSSPLITSLANIVFAMVGFIHNAISGDWTTAWNYAKDVIANVGTVVVMIMQTMANALLLVFRNIVHWINSHWEQISAGTMKALEWLFSTTEGWMIIFTLMMFRGFRNMALGVLGYVVWMANKFVGAIIWIGAKLGIWGAMWKALQLIAGAGGKAIVAITVLFGKAFLGIFKTIGARMVTWPFFAWLHGRYLVLYKNLIRMKAAWAAKDLTLTAAFGKALKAMMVVIGGILTNPWFIAFAVIISAFVLFYREIWRGMKGAGSALGAIGEWIGEMWINGWIKALNLGLSALDQFIRFAIRKINKIIRTVKKIPFLSIVTAGLSEIDEDFSVGRIGEVKLNRRSVADAWSEGSGGLSGSDFIKRAKDAWNSFKKPFNDVFSTIKSIGSDVFDYAEEIAEGMGEFITEIKAGNWYEAGVAAIGLLDKTIGDAFRFLTDVGGKLAKSVLAPASKAAIEAALGGLGYVFSKLDIALKKIKPLEDINPDEVRSEIYKILEDAGITPPSRTHDQEFGEGNLPDQDVPTTPEERKEASVNFITGMVEELKELLAGLFRVNEDGQVELPDGVDGEQLIHQLEKLGFNVDQLGDLWKDVNDQYEAAEPVTVDPNNLTSDLSPTGSSGPSRSLSGQLANLSLKVLVQIGDRPFEDAVVESLFSADRGGRLQGLDA